MLALTGPPRRSSSLWSEPFKRTPRHSRSYRRAVQVTVSTAGSRQTTGSAQPFECDEESGEDGERRRTAEGAGATLVLLVAVVRSCFMCWWSGGVMELVE